MRRWIVAAFVFLVARRRRRPLVDDEREPIVAPQDPSPRAELLVIVLLALAAALALGFVVVYASSADTQWLGLTLGGALAAITVACIVAAHALVPDEEEEEEYPLPRHPDRVEEIEWIRQRPILQGGEEERSGPELEEGLGLGQVRVTDDDVEAPVAGRVAVRLVPGVDDRPFQSGLEPDLFFEEVAALGELEVDLGTIVLRPDLAGTGEHLAGD